MILIIKNKKNSGFTLLELMISIFIFSLLMLSITFIFAKTIQAYKVSRNIQNNLENAQFALNSMAKIIREGKINSPSIDTMDGSAHSIRVINNGICYGYRLSGNNLEAGSNSNCGDIIYDVAVNNVEDVKFFITQNQYDSMGKPTKVGFVTILFTMCSDALCSQPDKMNLQTSVSLRNF